MSQNLSQLTEFSQTCYWRATEFDVTCYRHVKDMLQTCKIYVKVLLQTCNLRNSKKLPSKLLKHTYKKRFLILKKYIKKLQDTIQAHITLKLSVFLVIYISIKELSSALARGLLKCTESFLGSCIFEKFATLTDVLCEATLCTRDCSQ